MYRHKTAANARRCLGDLKCACPIRIRTILTGMARRSPTGFGMPGRPATRQPAFETLCSTLGIVPQLPHQDRRKPTAWLSGSTGPIEDVLQRQHVRSGDKLGMTLHCYVWLYNRPLAQSALGRKTPLQAMKKWHKRKPEFFNK